MSIHTIAAEITRRLPELAKDSSVNAETVIYNLLNQSDKPEPSADYACLMHMSLSCPQCTQDMRTMIDALQAICARGNNETTSIASAALKEILKASFDKS
jgi:hypothetical protein